MSWRFARRPSWILRHLLVLVLVVVMVNLGFWQLRRLDERRDLNALIGARQDDPVAAIETLVDPGAATDGALVRAAEHRTATATGRYDSDGTVVVANRTHNGAPGGWVLTPLVLEDGTAVIVNRGFVGFDRDGDIRPPDPPAGEVEVTGLVQLSQRRGSFGPTDPAEGRLQTLARADLDRIEQQAPHDLLPVYLQLERSDPSEAAAPSGRPELVPLEPPVLGEGPHLGYAVQWFAFSTIALVGYPLILRRVARQEATERDVDVPGEPDDLDRELEALLRSQP